MKPTELKYKAEVFDLTDIKMTPCTLEGFTSKCVWIRINGKLKQYCREEALKRFGVIYH